MNRSAKAVWNGTIKEGKGNLTTQSTTLDQTPYSFVSRFDEGKGTNPEELMAAAHAGCFTMKLSLDLTTAGFNPEALETTAVVTLDNGVITKSALTLYAKIDGISEEQFLEIAQKAKETCPVSKAYNLEITLETHLN
ncbi:OsmC family protein [Flavobacterium piscis]|uniref:Osmotically inducible protein OsmC n=1 Tax=Flavobacterium piscis TaxID=1114874 RepID=A0ABU1Y9H5_9FLAO|nr:OsmC family protein [Flavobacterium piscis]MDR7210310.1 osmotically inducible protein OsmC [Flavobacterium piscis]